MNPVKIAGISLLIVSAISALVVYNILNLDGPTGPESDPQMRMPMRIDIYHFEAKLVGRPDQKKLYEWSAVPVSDHWNDTLLIDFDYGPEIDEQKEGDVIWIVSEFNTHSQAWEYWTAEHWKQFRLPEKRAW